MNAIFFNLNKARSNRAVFSGLRTLAVAASIATCTSLAGCASDTQMAAKDASWAVVGNNGGKADRYAIARAASLDASMRLASVPSVNGAPQ